MTATTPNTWTLRTKAIALTVATRLEVATRNPHYVIETIGCWIVTTTMPLLGEWYTADGIQHGGAKP